MRHASRATIRNASYVLGGLCCALGVASYIALHDRSPEIVTVTEYRYLPGEKCVGIDVAAEPVPGIPGVLDRLLNRHRHRPHGGATPVVPALPPLACPAPEGPITRGESGEHNSVAEPGTLALMALAVPFVALRRRA